MTLCILFAPDAQLSVSFPDERLQFETSGLAGPNDRKVSLNVMFSVAMTFPLCAHKLTHDTLFVAPDAFWPRFCGIEHSQRSPFPCFLVQIWLLQNMQ